MTEQTHEQARAAALAEGAEHARYTLDALLEVFAVHIKDGTFEGDPDLEHLALARIEEMRREHARAYAEHRAAQVAVEQEPEEGEPNLTYEQNERLTRLILRADALVNIRALLEDLPDEVFGLHERWLMLDAVCSAYDTANEEVERYKRELGY